MESVSAPYSDLWNHVKPALCAALVHPHHWPVAVLCALLLDGLHLLLRVSLTVWEIRRANCHQSLCQYLSWLASLIVHKELAPSWSENFLKNININIKLIPGFVSRFQVWMGAPALVCECSGRLFWGACHGSQRHQCQSCAIMHTTWLHSHSDTWWYIHFIILHLCTLYITYITWLVWTLCLGKLWCFMSCVSVIGCTSSASDFPSPSSAISALVQASKPMTTIPGMGSRWFKS